MARHMLFGKSVSRLYIKKQQIKPTCHPAKILPAIFLSKRMLKQNFVRGLVATLTKKPISRFFGECSSNCVMPAKAHRRPVNRSYHYSKNVTNQNNLSPRKIFAHKFIQKRLSLSKNLCGAW